MLDPVIFYDGDCGFCNRIVQFVLRNEKSDQLRFAPLQSEFATQFFAEHNVIIDMSTFYFFNGTGLYSRSGGAFRVCKYLRFPWNLGIIGLIIPAFLRDAVYNFISKRRKQIVSQQCLLPTPEQRKRFLR